MNYIKFDTITSTNDFLKSYGKIQSLPDFFYIYTDWQTGGRGQRTNTWQSDCCKNVLISYFLKPGLAVSQQAHLNQMVAVAIVKVLQKFNIPDLKIKLPNDIMADEKKIAGILIENIIAGQNWKQSIIGIGINVNQKRFEHLPQATSMSLLTRKNYDVEEIIKLLTQELKELYKQNSGVISRDFQRFLIQQ